MAVYNVDDDGEVASLEHHLYGSSRLGIRNTSLDEKRNVWYLDKKRYKLSNHLGNVLSVISDRKLGEDGDLDGDADIYSAQVLSYSDYYPFGMLMPGRSDVFGEGYRFGFNGMEEIPEIAGNGNHIDFGARGLDTRIGRFLSLDPLSGNFPSESNYSFAGNSPIYLIDNDGQYKYPANKAADYRRDYPLLTRYLEKNVMIDIATSSNILNGFKKYSGGNLDYEKTMEAVTWDRGPYIVISDNVDLNANGEYKPNSNTIIINKRLADKLENSSLEDREAALYNLFVTLTHETVHYGDYLDGKRMSIEEEPEFGSEPGTAFQQDVFYTTFKKDEEGNIWNIEVPIDSDSLDDTKSMIKMNIKDGKADIIPNRVEKIPSIKLNKVDYE